jgi:hypothetical protein
VPQPGPAPVDTLSTFMVDWATVSGLATGFGTLVLAVATFASVRSNNRTARAAERSLLLGLRPLLMHSRLQDPAQKISFVDQHWVHVNGGSGAADLAADAIYLAISLRNAGHGIAILHGWSLNERVFANEAHADLDSFHRLTRDIYIPPEDIGFWQGALLDPSTEEFARIRDAIQARQGLTIDLLYGDHEGGQRRVTRFTLLPRGEDGWIAAAARHWNIDQADPR